jgi:D-serine deaminase-like pyridoxal phosphate-dependent protein
MNETLLSTDTLLLDDRIRGVPPGTSGLPASAVGALNWHPAEGVMALPVLTLDEAAFASNRNAMLEHVKSQGLAIAPHAKTPMAPALARSLVEAGAWGTTVADIRQASVMLRAGLGRLILANEVGGIGGARRLAAFLANWPDAELYVFADSLEAVQALAAAWREYAALQPLRVLVELGAGRAGARTLADAEAIVDAVTASGGRLALAGVATYEGAAGKATPEETRAAICGLLTLTGETLRIVRSRVGAAVPLVVTAGGSAYFDLVEAIVKPLVTADGAATLVLRSGAIFFSDHGLYDRSFAAMDERSGFAKDGRPASARTLFRPALRLWAEVLSCPEPGLAVAGLGMRDTSFDQGFPVPLRVYRAGRVVDSAPAARITRLNDQHAFLARSAGDDLRVGDVIEFGISHPCTCLDRYRVIFAVDASGRVKHAYPTYFG